MAYQKKGNDAQFRRVSLRSGRIPAFENFDAVSVHYDRDCVLEVRKTDGTTVVEYEWDRIPKAILREGNLIKIPQNIPLHRLWVRERYKNAMAYKIPDTLELKDNNQIFEVPAGSREVEVFGDKYFSAVYDLINP